MPPKRKSAKASASTQPTYVYLLTMKEYSHSVGEMTDVIGVYESKEAAAASAGGINTSYGMFDYAIENDFCDDHEDNRSDPPDDGTLIQIGSSDVGEGDFICLVIKKLPILGMPTASSKKKSKKKKRDLSESIDGTESPL